MLHLENIHAYYGKSHVLHGVGYRAGFDIDALQQPGQSRVYSDHFFRRRCPVVEIRSRSGASHRIAADFDKLQLSRHHPAIATRIHAGVADGMFDIGQETWLRRCIRRINQHSAAF